MNQSIIEWILAVIGSGGIGAIGTYIFTFKSRQKLIEAEAESTVVEVALKKLDLKLDLYEYLQTTCDKYIRDYHALEKDFRDLIYNLRELMDKIMLEKSQDISSKCNDIAALKSKVTYLKGIRCYNFTCEHRIKVNPNNDDE